MRFIDETRVFVAGGAGGKGCVAFLRERFNPKGGPSGGDGGDGGSVILEATTRASTLLDLHFKRHYKAERGKHGEGNDRHGANGRDSLIPVPIGTIVFDEETGAVLGDLTEDGQQLVVAGGARAAGVMLDSRTPSDKLLHMHNRVSPVRNVGSVWNSSFLPMLVLSDCPTPENRR